jgi:hypothetical protein
MTKISSIVRKADGEPVDMIEVWVGELKDGRPYVGMNLMGLDQAGDLQDVIISPLDAYWLGKRLVELSGIKVADEAAKV